MSTAHWNLRVTIMAALGGFARPPRRIPNVQCQVLHLIVDLGLTARVASWKRWMQSGVVGFGMVWYGEVC